MKLLRARDRAEQPWRNGGGVTFGVAAAPPDASIAQFDWRISIARIEREGEFSLFPAVDRRLMLLDGGPLELEFSEKTISLARGDPPVAFPGEAGVRARPVGRTATVLNVMNRRGGAETAVWWQRPGQVAAPSPPEMLFLLGTATRTAVGDVVLSRYDAVQVADAGVELAVEAVAIRVRAAAAAR